MRVDVMHLLYYKPYTCVISWIFFKAKESFGDFIKHNSQGIGSYVWFHLTLSSNYVLSSETCRLVP
jgi:hypothetical protein